MQLFYLAMHMNMYQVLEKAIKIQHATEKFKNRHDAKRLNSKICEGLMIWHERARNLVVAGV
jgi:hypothetical protein